MFSPGADNLNDKRMVRRLPFFYPYPPLPVNNFVVFRDRQIDCLEKGCHGKVRGGGKSNEQNGGGGF
jgi:hypothetical protein